MSLTLHLEHAGRSARVALHGLPQQNPRPRPRQATPCGDVASCRIVTGVRRDAAPTFDALVQGDPELDLALAGIELAADAISPAWYDPTAAQRAPVADFADIDIVYDAAGVEKARRPHLVRRPNLNELHPIKLTKRLPADDALLQFAFKQTLQVAHTDGLTFEFLRELARDLATRREVGVLGAGPKSNQPLVLREHGTAYRAFLYGEVDDAGRYKLLLLLSDQELKRAERTGEPE